MKVWYPSTSRLKCYTCIDRRSSGVAYITGSLESRCRRVRSHGYVVAHTAVRSHGYVVTHTAVNVGICEQCVLEYCYGEMWKWQSVYRRGGLWLALKTVDVIPCTSNDIRNNGYAYFLFCCAYCSQRGNMWTMRSGILLWRDVKMKKRLLKRRIVTGPESGWRDWRDPPNSNMAPLSLYLSIYIYICVYNRQKRWLIYIYISTIFFCLFLVLSMHL